jgi:putative endonuclease
VTDSRRALGEAGEAAAVAYLESRGYRVLARNVRADRVEIDVVVERRGVIAFVEVKTRSGSRFGTAAEAVDARKRARLARGAAAWLRATRRHPRSVRFDVVTCEGAGERLRVTHWPGAFELGD